MPGPVRLAPDKRELVVLRGGRAVGRRELDEGLHLHPAAPAQQPLLAPTGLDLQGHLLRAVNVTAHPLYAMALRPQLQLPGPVDLGGQPRGPTRALEARLAQ